MSIQVGLNGLSFLVLDLFTKKVELIRDIKFAEKITPQQLLKNLIEEFDNIDLLNENFNKIQVIHDNEVQTLSNIVTNSRKRKNQFIELDEIQIFCKKNYGVTFLMTEKISVKGNNQHPLYNWLTDKSLNGVKNSTVKWNFQKYIVDREGNLIDYFYSMTRPLSSKITKIIK